MLSNDSIKSLSSCALVVILLLTVYQLGLAGGMEDGYILGIGLPTNEASPSFGGEPTLFEEAIRGFVLQGALLIIALFIHLKRPRNIPIFFFFVSLGLSLLVVFNSITTKLDYLKSFETPKSAVFNTWAMNGLYFDVVASGLLLAVGLLHLFICLRSEALRNDR